MELHQRTAKYTCQQSSSFNNSSFKNKQTKQQTKIEQTNVICWHKIPLQLYEVNMNNTIFGCCSAPWTNGTFNSLPCFGLFSVHPFPVSGCSVSTPSDKSVPRESRSGLVYRPLPSIGLQWWQTGQDIRPREHRKQFNKTSEREFMFIT